MKLISMTDFVLQQQKNAETNGAYIRSAFRYANFLKKPLTLGMFVPCDLEGNVLEKPKKENYTEEELKKSDLGYDWDDYQQAEQRVLFKYVDPNYMFNTKGLDCSYIVERYETI